MAISYLAILGAAIAGFMFGGVFYTVLGKPWLDAQGKTEADIAKMDRSLPVSLGINFVCGLIMAWVFAGLMLHLSKSGVPASLRNGMLSGAFCWLGFIATSLAANLRFQGGSFRLWLIDSAHWLGVLLLQGAILGAFGIRA